MALKDILYHYLVKFFFLLTFLVLNQFLQSKETNIYCFIGDAGEVNPTQSLVVDALTNSECSIVWHLGDITQLGVKSINDTELQESFLNPFKPFIDTNVPFYLTVGNHDYKGNPKVQAHGPGFSKILIGDDCVDNWEEYIDLIVESIFINGGRGCINTSSIWASRHTEEIAQALAEKLGPVEALAPTDPNAGLAAFTIDGMATAIWDSINDDLEEDGVTHVTAQYGDRLVEKELCGYIRPTIVHCKSPENAIAKKEYMFPFASVVECPEDQMLRTIGETLVCTGITNNESLRHQFIDCTDIDRLNLGPVPTTKLNWLQPHEGNIIDFLFRNRAFQVPEELL